MPGPTPQEITLHHDSDPPEGQDPFVGERGPARPIEVVPYDERWPSVFEELSGRIRAALRVRALSVEHVGSTSVVGLPAKPVIDVDLVVADPADEEAWLPDLEAAGFVLRIREPWWHEHRCVTTTEPRSNVHVFGPDCPETIRHAMFRDWLREHPDDLELYRDTKVAAADATTRAGEHVMDYNARKEQVIREIYDRAFRAAGLL